MLSNYIIEQDGRIYGKLRKKYLKPSIKPHGYMQVYLKQDDGKSKWYYVHRLVASEYVPNPDNKPIVGHLDNNPGNNHYTNLKWMTYKENTQQSISEGRFVVNTWEGTNSPMYGKSHSSETKAKMSAAKVGINHPKFKGYYIYEGKRYVSAQSLADYLGTYSVKVFRMFRKGLIEFQPIS